MMNELVERSRTLRYIEGLKGVAAVIVVIYHYLVAFYPAFYTGNRNDIHTESGIEVIVSGSPLNLFYDGSVSVCLFFVISGFVLTCFFYQSGDLSRMISIAARRFLRMNIPVIISLVISYLFMIHGLFMNYKAAEVTLSAWLGSFYGFDASLILLFQQCLGGVIWNVSTTYNPTLWTMHYEFYGSYIAIFIAIVFGKLRNRWLFYVMFLLIAYNSYFFPFVIGVILADISRHFVLHRSAKVVALVTGMFLASYPPARPVENTFYEFMQMSFIKYDAFFWQSIGSGLIFMVVIHSELLKKLLSCNWMCQLGKISFPVYIVHFTVLCSLSCRMFMNLYRQYSYHLSVVITFLLSSCVIILLAKVYFLLIERNMDQLLKRMYYRWFSR